MDGAYPGKIIAMKQLILYLPVNVYTLLSLALGYVVHTLHVGLQNLSNKNTISYICNCNMKNSIDTTS